MSTPPQTIVPPQVPQSNPERSASAQEYEHLISYFKFLVTITLSAFAVIIGIASFFFYKNMSDLRGDATRAIESTRERGLAVIFQHVVPLQLPRKPVVAGAVRKWKSAVTISKARTYRAAFCTARSGTGCQVAPS